MYVSKWLTNAGLTQQNGGQMLVLTKRLVQNFLFRHLRHNDSVTNVCFKMVAVLVYSQIMGLFCLVKRNSYFPKFLLIFFIF